MALGKKQSHFNAKRPTAKAKSSQSAPLFLAIAMVWMLGAPAAYAQEKLTSAQSASSPTTSNGAAALPAPAIATPASALLLPASTFSSLAPPLLIPAIAPASPIDAMVPAPSISTLTPAAEVSLVPSKNATDVSTSLGLKVEKTTELTPVDTDLWNRIRNGFIMEALDTPLVQEQEQWYAARPDYIKRLVERGAKYLHHIVEEVEKRGMPMELALLPVIESAFNPQAYSRAKAAGMWQFIPSTGKVFGLQQDALNDHRRDVLASTTAALAYLQKLYGMFNAWDLALAAYNCGEGCVGRAIAANQRRGLPTHYLALNLPKETKQYVPKLLAIRNIVLSPGSYGLVLDSVPDQPYFAKVAAPSRIDLKLAAHFAELSLDDFKALNPSFNKPIAAGSLGYFLLPQDRAETFRHNLAAHQATRAPLVSWTTYTARVGENLDVIGKRYGISGQSLRFANPGVRERRGKLSQATTLQVPLGRETASIDAKMRQAPAVRAAMPASSPAKVFIPAQANAGTKASVSVAQAAMLGVVNLATKEGIAPSESAIIAPSLTNMPTAASNIPRAQSTQEQASESKIIVPTVPAFAVSAADGAIVTAAAIVTVQSKTALATAPQQTTPTPVDINAAPTSIIVKAGDSIFGISKATGVLMVDIKAFNNLRSNAIYAGQRLKLTGDAVTAAPTKPAVITTATTVTSKDKPQTPQNVKTNAVAQLHTVRIGDTLSGIADQHRLPLSELLRINGFSTRTVLKLGAKVKLPS